jgi:hypothetical protein
MEESKALRVLVEDCLNSPGDSAMSAPMMKAARVVPLDDAELRLVAGGPRITNDGEAPPLFGSW